MSRPLSADTIPDGELKTANTQVVVLNAYATSMTLLHDGKKAFEAAIRAWRERNPAASPEDARTAVVSILAIGTTTSAASSLMVFVPKPAGISYGEAMNSLRTWLDSQKMQPTLFRLSSAGRAGFEIGFRSDADAARFESMFTDW